MKKITQELIQKYLAENKIELRCTHAKLCVPIIDRLYRKMYIGIKFSGIKVDEDLICDGHHRYVASLLAEFPIESVPFNKTSATEVIDWKSITFEEEDWDSPKDIDRLNQRDADFNNISIEELVKLLK